MARTKIVPPKKPASKRNTAPAPQPQPNPSTPLPQLASDAAAIAMEGMEYIDGLLLTLMDICEHGDVNARSVLSIARAARYVSNDYFNTLDSIHETALNEEAAQRGANHAGVQP